jgi:hypothetical protein
LTLIVRHSVAEETIKAHVARHAERPQRLTDRLLIGTV